MPPKLELDIVKQSLKIAAPGKMFSLIWEKNQHCPHTTSDCSVTMASTKYYTRIIIRAYRKPLDFLYTWLTNDLFDSFFNGWASVDFMEDQTIRIGNHIHVYSHRPYTITSLADPDCFRKIGTTVCELMEQGRRR